MGRQHAPVLVCVHVQNIIHRDIKAESIFLSSTSGVKLGDFGFSVPVNPSVA